MSIKRPNPIKGNKPFPKGVSGNPKGRPKLPDIREAMARLLSDEKDGAAALDTMLAALRIKAESGDVRAAEVLLDRAYGKSQQTMDITSAGHRIPPPIMWSDGK